jgi:rhodanese-related sulfurtransferase
MIDRSVRSDAERRWFGGAVGVAIVGVALGIAYNAVGLGSAPAFGLPWIASDRTEDVFVLEIDATTDGAPAADVADIGTDDPFAAMMGQAVEAAPSAVELPEIPSLPRPIQMQLPIVKRFFDADAALFLDAREADEYAEGHVPGALHVPFDTAVTDPALLESLPAGGRPIIVYCGGGSCEVSINLAWELIGAGHSPVTYFQGGYPDWVAAGYPTATGAEGGGR